MLPDSSLSRRRLLKTLFCSSVAMKLNLGPSVMAEPVAAAGSLDFLALGDFGSGDERQEAVARGMARYAEALAKKTDGLLLLGDNFYGPMHDGVKSKRWQTGFSDVYPSELFPAPCWAVLGNHDYHDNPGYELVQLGYAASLARKTRWTMPGKFYRVDLPAKNPQVTFLMIDTNWESINKSVHPGGNSCWMTAEEQLAQKAWLEKQLASSRAPFTVVIGHHPLYSDAKHGDTKPLVSELGPLFEQSGVHLYLCGHDHDLQHLELEGLKTSFVVSGGGGARLYEHKELRQSSVVMDVYGFTHLSFLANRLLIRHIDPNGKIVHAFSKGVNYDWKIEDA